MNRKQRRSLDKHMGKDVAENLAQKISQFGKLPQQCSACQKEFDKQDKQMVQSWSVVVKQEVVRLFCPECINTAKEMLESNGSQNKKD
tara:strand:+ start:168 stop:431 length:264 start_codon:yes stop_codon:yes gene_type:complete